MDITQDELQFIYQLGRESGRTEIMNRGDKHEEYVFENMRYENKNMIDFIHFVKMHYPEAIAEYDAVNKIKES